MAIHATINKISLNIANIDRHYYHTHELTIAQHPSETDYRFMIRVIAFAANANEQLHFCKGLDDENEPELWQKNLTDDIELWIDLGQPDEKRIRKACGHADQVIIYTYHERKAKTWWKQHQGKLQRFKNLQVIHIDAEGVDSLLQRTMHLQCNIQDDVMYLSDDEQSYTVILNIWQLQTH